METKTRREREKEEIQRRILDAAREVLTQEGDEAVTMRRIAEAIDYTPTALYFHFRDKEALLRRLCHEDFEKLAARFRVLTRVPDPLDRLRMLARGYVAFAVEHPNVFRLAYGSESRRGAKPHEEVRPEGAVYALIRKAAAEAVGAGRVRPDCADADLVAQTLWAGAHGVAALAIERGDDHAIAWRPLDERVEALVEGLVRGLT